MIETVEPTIEVTAASAKRGQFTNNVEITNRLGYPIAVIMKNGINAVIHPALSITTDGTLSIAVTYSANHHCTLNQLSNFYKENPSLAKKVPASTPGSPRTDLVTLEYTLTDSQLGYEGTHYVDDLDMIVCAGIASQHIHPRSTHYVKSSEPEPDITTITLAGCGDVGERYYVLFSDFIFPVVNSEFGISRPKLTFASTDQDNPIKSFTLNHGDVFKTEEDAIAERTLRNGSYNEASAELIKGVKGSADNHFKAISGVSKDYVVGNNDLIGSANDMSSAVSKLEQDIAEARVHQRKVAGETIKLFHPLVTTIGKVATL